MKSAVKILAKQCLDGLKSNKQCVILLGLIGIKEDYRKFDYKKNLIAIIIYEVVRRKLQSVAWFG